MGVSMFRRLIIFVLTLVLGVVLKAIFTVADRIALVCVLGFLAMGVVLLIYPVLGIHGIGVRTDIVYGQAHIIASLSYGVSMILSAAAVEYLRRDMRREFLGA